MEPTQEQLDAFYAGLFDDAFKRKFQDYLSRLIREYFVTGRMWELEGFSPDELAENLDRVDTYTGEPHGYGAPERFTSMLCLLCLSDPEHRKEHQADGPPWIPTQEDLEEADELARKKQDDSSSS